MIAKNRYTHIPGPVTAQSGAALVMGLVVLLILTLLGVSALRTSSLEQLMSGNIQEMIRSLEIADSGASKVIVDLTTFNSIPSSGNFQDFSYNVTGSNDASQGTARVYKSIHVQITNNFSDRSNSKPGGLKTGYAFFDQVVRGRTTTASTVLQQGVRKPSPVPNSETIN